MGWDNVRDHWKDGVEILILSIAIYQIYRAFRATRGARILVGLVVILVAVTLVLFQFKFQVITWLVTRAAILLVFALPIIFQPELRNALAKLGSSRLFSFSNKSQLDFLETFEDSVVALSKKRIGALFAIERDISMKPYEETGAISICMEGILERNLGEEKFRKRMAQIFLSNDDKNETSAPKELDPQDRVASSGDRDLVSD